MAVCILRSLVLVLVRCRFFSDTFAHRGSAQGPPDRMRAQGGTKGAHMSAQGHQAWAAHKRAHKGGSFGGAQGAHKGGSHERTRPRTRRAQGELCTASETVICANCHIHIYVLKERGEKQTLNNFKMNIGKTRVKND